MTKIGKSYKISKKVAEKFGRYIKKLYLCIAFQGKRIKFGLWCNGSTTGFGSVCPGSNPGSPTDESPANDVCGAFYFPYMARWGSFPPNIIIVVSFLSEIINFE